MECEQDSPPCLAIDMLHASWCISNEAQNKFWKNIFEGGLLSQVKFWEIPAH